MRIQHGSLRDLIGKQWLSLYVMTLHILSITALSSGIIDFHNLGYVLKPIGSMNVFNAKAHMTFAISLPDPLILSTQSLNCSGRHRIVTKCDKLGDLVVQVQRMHEHLQNQTNQSIALLYSMVDTLEAETRTRRSHSWVPNWLSGLLSSMTGLAESSDIDSMQQTVKRIETLLLKGTQSFSVSQSHVAQLMSVQNQRMDELQSLAAIGNQDIHSLFTTLTSLSNDEENTHLLMARMMDRIQNFTIKITAIESIQQSVQLMFTNKLPIHLIPLASMDSMLATLGTYLESAHPHLSIVHMDALFYYRQTNFLTFRRANKLFIVVDCPLSSYESFFAVYSIHLLPLPIHGTPGHYSVLDISTRAIAISNHHYIEIINEIDLSNVPRLVNLNMSPLQLKDRKYLTCATALFDGDKGILADLCQYHVIQGPLPRLVVRLSPTCLYLSNISNVRIDCDTQSFNKSNSDMEFPLILTVPCACEIQADEFTIPRMVQSCNANDTFELANFTSYVINLMYLTNFFADDKLTDILGDTIFSIQPNISVPILSLNTREYSMHVALANQAKLDMQTAINATKYAQPLYDSLSNVVMQQLLESQGDSSSFNFFSFRDWLLVLLSVITTISVTTTVYLSFKVRALTAIIVISSHTKGALSASVNEEQLLLHYFVPQINTPPPLDIAKLTERIAQLIPVDVTLLFGLIAIFIAATLFGLVRWYRRHFPAPQTTICLQIGNLESSMLIKWGEFLHQPEFYKFNVQVIHGEQIFLTIKPVWFGLYEVAINGLILRADHKFLDLNVNVTLTNHVIFYTAKQIKTFTQSPYFVAFLMKDTEGKICSCCQLKSFVHAVKAQDEVEAPPRLDLPSLYPALDLAVQAV